MAVSLLSSGVLSATANPNTSVQIGVLKPVSTNRRLVAAVALKHFNFTLPLGADVAPVVTYGGVTLSPFTRDTDGSSASFRIQQVGTFFSKSAVYLFGLNESEIAPLPGGSNNLIASFAPGSDVWQFSVGYWFLGNCDQGPRIRHFDAVSQSSAATVLAGTVLGGGTSDAVVVAGINGTSSGTIQITINGTGLTEDWDQSFPSLGARFAGGNRVSGVPLGPTAFDLTYTAPAANSRAAVALGLRLAEFFPVNPGNSVIYGGPGSAVSLEAS